MTGKEMKELGYPSKQSGKEYMVFDVFRSDFNAEAVSKEHLIEHLMGTFHNHVNGTPVFIEP